MIISFLKSGKNIQYFTINYNVNSRFWEAPLIRLKKFLFIPRFLSFLNHEWVLNLLNGFSAPTEINHTVCVLNSEMWLVTLIDFQILNQPCTSRINTLSRCIIPFMYDLIQLIDFFGLGFLHLFFGDIGL